MATFIELKHQTEKFMKEAVSLADKLGFETGAQNIREQIDVFRKRELMVVTAGEAKKGKSSLLNALLNEKSPLFPVEINVCTNVVTIVRYGETEKIEAYIEDAKEEKGFRIETIGRDQIPDFVSERGNPNNYKQVKMLKASIPNELLKEGVVFVDTPGVGSLNIEHAEATYGFLPNADMLLFVTDAASGLTESELNFLKRGYQYCKNILFPMTKKDLNSNFAAILEDNRSKISAALALSSEEVQMIPVSSAAKLRYLSTGSKTMYQNSNFESFENAIWEMIARKRGEMIILPFLVAAKNELLKMMDSTAAQYQLLDRDKADADKLVMELNRKMAAMEALQDNGASWRSQLTLFFSMLQNDINMRQQQLAADARDLVDEKVKSMGTKLCKENQYTSLLREVNDLIGQGIISIREDITDQINQKTVELESQMDFDISVNQNILDKLEYTPREMPKVTFPPKKLTDRALKMGRNVAINTSGGTTAGMILGGLVGFCFGGPAGAYAGAELGVAFGGLLGGAKGCVDSLNKYDTLDVNVVNKALVQYITSSMSGVGGAINNTLAELRVLVNSSFDQQLQKRSREYKENVAQMQKSINLSKNDIPQRRAALEKQDMLLRQHMSQCESLEEAINGMEDRVGQKVRAKKVEEPSYGFL